MAELKGAELRDDLAALAGLPKYKVGKMLTWLARVVEYECARGNQVTIPRLGSFTAKIMRAKVQKNVIAGRGENVILRQTKTYGTRRKLNFEPINARRWLPINPDNPRA